MKKLLTPPQPSWLNKASLIEFNCSILAEEVLLLLPFPFAVDTPLELALGLGGLLTPLVPLAELLVPMKTK